jgi:nucleoside-diphosphate-sugar epimerase
LAVKGPKKALGETFNIASGKSLSIKTLYKKIQKAAKKTNRAPQYAKKREGDVYKSVADTTKAQKILGFKPAITIEEGLKRYIQWYESVGGKN